MIPRYSRPPVSRLSSRKACLGPPAAGGMEGEQVYFRNIYLGTGRAYVCILVQPQACEVFALASLLGIRAATITFDSTLNRDEPTVLCKTGE